MPQQQVGYKAAILSLSVPEITLQRGTGPYKGRGEGIQNRQRPVFLPPHPGLLPGGEGGGIGPLVGGLELQR